MFGCCEASLASENPRLQCHTLKKLTTCLHLDSRAADHILIYIPSYNATNMSAKAVQKAAAVAPRVVEVGKVRHYKQESLLFSCAALPPNPPQVPPMVNSRCGSV